MEKHFQRNMCKIQVVLIESSELKSLNNIHIHNDKCRYTAEYGFYGGGIIPVYE